MNTTDPRDIPPEAIAKLLTRATEQLDSRTVTALRRSRNLALEKQSLHRPVFALSTGHGLRWLMPHTASQWMATIILLMAALAGGADYWHQSNERAISHLDLSILTDDLPMEIFLDR